MLFVQLLALFSGLLSQSVPQRKVFYGFAPEAPHGGWNPETREPGDPPGTSGLSVRRRNAYRTVSQADNNNA